MHRFLRRRMLQRPPTLNTTHTHCSSHLRGSTALYDDADEGSFLELTGFSRPSFLPSLYYSRSCSLILLLKHLDKKDKLGLYLFYINRTMALNNLCLIFGTTPSRLTCWQSLLTVVTHLVNKVLLQIWADIQFSCLDTIFLGTTSHITLLIGLCLKTKSNSVFWFIFLTPRTRPS